MKWGVPGRVFLSVVSPLIVSSKTLAASLTLVCEGVTEIPDQVFVQLMLL